MTNTLAIMHSLTTYLSEDGFMPRLLVSCASVTLILAALFALYLRRANANAKQWRTLQAILTIASPAERRMRLQQLHQHMCGIDRLLLEVVLSTPLGAVRKNRLLTTLERKRAELGSLFYRLCQLALLCPLMGLLLTLVNSSSDPGFAAAPLPADAATMPLDQALLPFWFAAAVASPALLMLVLTRIWLKAYFAELEKHTHQFSQLPAGQ